MLAKKAFGKHQLEFLSYFDWLSNASGFKIITLNRVATSTFVSAFRGGYGDLHNRTMPGRYSSSILAMIPKHLFDSRSKERFLCSTPNRALHQSKPLRLIKKCPNGFAAINTSLGSYLGEMACGPKLDRDRIVSMRLLWGEGQHTLQINGGRVHCDLRWVCCCGRPVFWIDVDQRLFLRICCDIFQVNR